MTLFIKDYFSAFLDITNEMSPYLILGFLIAGILHVFFPSQKMDRILGRSNFKSVLNASLIGIPLPLCSCGVIPTGVSFHKHGASKGSTVSFLISTPQTGVDSIMVTYSLIGLPFAVIRVIIALVTGIIGGIVTNLSVKGGDVKSPDNKGKENTEINRIKHPFIEIFRYAFIDFIRDIAKWLVIGLLIAALITVLVPDDFFSSTISNEYLGMFIVLIASVPLYVCATGSVPIAAALLLKGLSPGAALVFLMAGPATNAATITVIGKVMGRRTLFSYLGTIIMGSILAGLLINSVFPGDMFTRFITIDEHAGHHDFLPYWLQLASTIILAFFLLRSLLLDVYQKYVKRNHQKDIQSVEIVNNMSTLQLSVKGMTCNHCKMTVEKNLNELDEIEQTEAAPEKNMVTIKGGNVNLDRVKETVEGLGYTYEGEIS